MAAYSSSDKSESSSLTRVGDLRCCCGARKGAFVTRTTWTGDDDGRPGGNELRLVMSTIVVLAAALVAAGVVDVHFKGVVGFDHAIDRKDSSTAW